MLSPELVRAIRRIEMRARRLVNESLAGEYHAVFKGRGIEFDEVRPYQPGDEVRTIDWNVTARLGEPYVKRFSEERELTVMLAFDASASGRFGTADRFRRELAAELGAVLAFSAIFNNDKVGLLAFSDRVELHIPPHKGRRHVLRLIRELLAFEPSGRGTDVLSALHRLNRTLKRRTIIFLISDFLTPHLSGDAELPYRGRYEHAFLVTNRRHDLVAVTVTDPREVSWPDAGLLVLEDAETGAIRWVDSGNAAWRRAFVERSDAWRSSRDTVFNRAKVDRIDVTLGQDYVGPLLTFFELRARRLRR